MTSPIDSLCRAPAWLRVIIALAIPVVVFGIYLRFAALQDVFCRAPDELAEMMPGLRLHALPILNLRDPIRYNFVQSLFYSQHGLGDVSFYYLASGALSLLGFPIGERYLFAAGGLTNLGLAVAGGILAVWLFRSAGTGWIFAILVLISPFYVSPYVFHLSSDVYLGHIGEFYYGLSYVGGLRPVEHNHLLDFGLNQFHREHAPEAFYRPYGEQHFDYYVEFVERPDPLTRSSLDRLAREGFDVVCNIFDDGRLIGRVYLSSGQPAFGINYQDAETGWDRMVSARTLVREPLAGTAYHWRTPE
jgi:hypothetical protein